MELKRNILSFSEASGLAKYNTNLSQNKEREGTFPTMNQESLSKSLQKFLFAFHFQSSITIAKTTISDFSVITATLCPSAETVQHKL